MINAESSLWLPQPAILSICLSVSIIAYLPLRLFALRSEKVKVESSKLAPIKLCLWLLLGLFAILQLLVVFQAERATLVYRFDICIHAIAILAACLLSYKEHWLSVCTADVVCAYLLFSAAIDLYSCFYPSQISNDFKQVGTFHIILCQTFVKLLGVMVESTSKRPILLSQRDYSAAELSGLLSRVFFFWINPILDIGNLRILTEDDMPILGHALNLRKVRTNILKAWNSSSNFNSKTTLPLAIYRTIKGAFWSAALPRAFVVVFRCAQPLLINKVVRYAQVPFNERQYAELFQIFLGSFSVYIGLVLSNSTYQTRIFKLRVLVRSAFTTLIYNKTLSKRYETLDAGQTSTLMNSDVDAVTNSAELAHETWAYMAELVVGMLILASQVEWLWFVPLVIIFFCTRVSRFVAQNMRPRQKAWSEATQDRMSALTAVLGDIKSFKATGSSEICKSYISKLRDKEIAAAQRLGWMQAIYNASANALGIFSPAITVVLFTVIKHVRGEILDIPATFTTVAVLSIVTHPANMVMTIMPEIVASLANFSRIEEYLNDSGEPSATFQSSPAQSRNHVVSFANFGFTGQGSRQVLRNINLQLEPDTVTICCGQVGSGKSVLSRAILGEVTGTSGLVHRQDVSVGYCDQTPWIPSGTIKEIICGFSANVDEDRYDRILKACCLEFDLLSLPLKDLTLIGSRGINVSGGQKQRIAVARLLYSGCKVAVFDDAFAGLDGTTEQQVVQNLFDSDGLLRKWGVSVFWVTNSAQYFSFADRVVLMNNGSIEKQGNWEAISKYMTILEKFKFEKSQDAEQSALLPSTVQQQAKNQAEKDAEDDLHRQAGDVTLYYFYLRSAGVWAILSVLGSASFFATFNTLPSFWIKLWAESDPSKFVFFVIGYLLLALLAWSGTTVNMWGFRVLLGPRSGRVLHQQLLSTIFAAPLSFFTANDVGAILNRFGQDIGLVDKQLAPAFAAFSMQVFKMIAQIAIILGVQRLVAATIPFCAIIVYFVQKRYLRTSRQLRVLELEAKATLYSAFVETVDGIITIRAFGWQDAIEQKTLDALDVSLRPYYLLMCLQRWLRLILQLLVNSLTVVMIMLTVAGGFGSETEIGVALNIVLITNTTLVRLITAWAQLEVSLGAISRLRDVEDKTDLEDKLAGAVEPPSSWPNHGSLVLRDVSVGYRRDQHVLQHIDLTLEPGQKLVICGRTGSGKSTIFLSLLGLVESKGSILVDGVDLSQLHKATIRERCFLAIPQDAGWIPHASLRFNLDPSMLASTAVLKDAVSKSGLWDVFASNDQEADDIFDQPLRQLPQLSAGQSQLLSMARAIVRKRLLINLQAYSYNGFSQGPKPIILLDEVTSSLDGASESRIYDVIESEFVADGHTVIIVSHRLGVLAKNMIQGRDKVAVVHDGTVTLEDDIARFLEGNAE